MINLYLLNFFKSDDIEFSKRLVEEGMKSLGKDYKTSESKRQYYDKKGKK